MSKNKVILITLISFILGIAVGVGTTLGLSYGKSTASSASATGEGLASWAIRAYDENWSYVWGGRSPGAVDAAGLISSYTGYTSGSDAMFASSEMTGDIDTLPEIPGLGLYMLGQVGVYIGEGVCVYVTELGIQMTSVSAMKWTDWFYVPNVKYTAS